MIEAASNGAATGSPPPFQARLASRPDYVSIGDRDREIVSPAMRFEIVARGPVGPDGRDPTSTVLQPEQSYRDFEEG
jgi:hypothetical protein